MAVDYLQTLAEDLLDAALDGTTEAITGNPPTTRNYVAHGRPVWDLCTEAQLVVYHGPVTHRQGNDKMCNWVPRSTFCAELARCVPSMDEAGNAPSPDELTASAEVLNRDLWALLHAVYGWAVEQGCSNVTLGNGEILEPSGGMAGVRVCLTVDLNAGLNP